MFRYYQPPRSHDIWSLAKAAECNFYNANVTPLRKLYDDLANSAKEKVNFYDRANLVKLNPTKVELCAFIANNDFLLLCLSDLRSTCIESCITENIGILGSKY